MKKYILGSLAVLALAACSNDELITDTDVKEPVVEQDVNTVESTIVGEYEQLGEEDMDNGNIIETRAGVGAGNEALWSNGDELSITNGTLMYNYNVTSTSNDGKNAVFKVEGDHKAHVSEDANNDAFYAMYPRRAITEANGAGKWNGATVTGQIFAQQSYVENMGKATNGNNFGGYYISTKKATVRTANGETNLDFEFTPLASVIDVDLSATTEIAADNFAAVYIRDLSGGTIAAHFSYDCVYKTLTTTGDGGCNYNYSSRSDVIEVNFFKGETDGVVSYESLGDDKVVRFYLLPQLLNDGIEITIRTKDGNYYTKKSSTSVGTAYGAEDFMITTEDTNLKGIVKPFYKKYKFGSTTTARTSSWMACLPQNIFYRMLSIPGSHDAATSSASALGKTQNKTIAEQLLLGVRAFDLRPSGKDPNNLELMHASIGTGVTLSAAINDMKTYLASHPSECLFAFIHCEEPTIGSVSESEKTTWSNNVYSLVKAAVDDGYALEALTSGIKFSHCRGKIIFIYRDDLTGDNKVYNAAKIPWNDNIARTVYLQGTNGANLTDFKVSYQDIYDDAALGESTAGLSGYFQQKGGVTSTTQKIDMVKKYIDFADTSTERMLILNFASYAGGILSSAGGNASSIMPTVNQYIVSKHERVGIIFSDYVDVTYGGYNFTTITMANNFKHVFTKRSRVDVIKNYNSGTSNGIGVGVAGDEYADDSEVFAKPLYRY
ncbi:hypothetical protein [Prevotella sp. P3-122]|uniref:hypothetical protein n=1 Tax=Prevotella sp. P3-122 TaxID=2024223 RepID=UPI000B977080|nr:hypothetical protein [Prevotella sp. P3-122]OYP57892.1 hypothetical protein CIL02_15385 [Prevotella sp. P3-122]